MSDRAHQALLILSTLLASWLGMQIVHELGHALGAVFSGGRVAKIVLSPLSISRTDLSENPHPLFVAWAGPVIGASLPLIIWGIAWVLRLPGTFVLRFFAGFCLLANGLYLAAGSFQSIGDAGDLLCHGAPVWTLWLFGLLTTPAGLGLWNRQAHHFGVGSAKGYVSRGVTYASLIALLILLGICLIVRA